MNNSLRDINCTAVYFIIHDGHGMVQPVILSLFLIYVLVINLLLIAVTFGTAKLRGCRLSMHLAAGYIGNIVGGLSVFGNDLYYTKHGISPPECKLGKDQNFFFYLGISMNMAIVVLNTSYRYRKMAAMKKISKSCRNIKSDIKDLFLKAWLPAWLVSICVALIASFLQIYVKNYQFLLTAIICVIPLTIAIIWNIRLSITLKNARKSSDFVGNSESAIAISRATFIINALIASHVTFLIIGTTATILFTFYVKDKSIVVGLTWLLRISYLVMFTIEGKLYIYAMPLARKTLTDKATALFHQVCTRNNDPVKTTDNNCDTLDKDPQMNCRRSTSLIKVYEYTEPSRYIEAITTVHDIDKEVKHDTL